MVLIAEDTQEAVEDKIMFNLLFSPMASRHADIINEDEFEALDLNLFNAGRALIIYSKGSRLKITTGSAGILIVAPSAFELLQHTLQRLVEPFHVSPPPTGPVFRETIYLPICNIYYQDPFIMGKKESILREVERLAEGIISHNMDYFYNKECRLTIIYSKKKPVTASDLENLKIHLNTKVGDRMKQRYNILLNFDFCEGDYDTHERHMLSDYFSAQSGREFTYKDTAIDFSGYLSNPEKYAFIYREMARRLGGESKIRIIKP